MKKIDEFFCELQQAIDLPDKARKKERDTAINIEDELRSKLSPELFELFKKHSNALTGELCDETDGYFREGFKLGLLLGVECAD